MPTIFVRPKKDFKIRDLTGAVIPPYGVEVEPNSFWVRKTNDQDVEEITEADFLKGKKAEEKRLLAEQAKNDTTPPAGV